MARQATGYVLIGALVVFVLLIIVSLMGGPTQRQEDFVRPSIETAQPEEKPETPAKEEPKGERVWEGVM